MIVIPVKSKVHGEHFIFIDGEDFDKVKDYKWCVVKDHTVFYAQTKIKGKPVRIHRLLLNFPKKPIDHRNGNGLDNTRENIRVCSVRDNMRNRRKKLSRSSSIYKDVSFEDNRYVAAIVDKGQKITLGRFKDEHDAGEAYNKKAIDLFGEFASLNKIQREDI